jgi:predicted DCC family thiol-disulfide oxidoreductase YuxK
LLVYDGDCRFCTLWIRRWQQTTGDAVDYLPFQDASIAERFPEISRAEFETAVQLIEPDGRIYSAAEAALRARSQNPARRSLLRFYERSPLFARVAERTYRFVAEHRTLVSALTRIAYGNHVERPSHFLVRWTFLRALGIIYLIAFISLWTQIHGLVGSNGILPTGEFMNAANAQVDQLLVERGRCVASISMRRRHGAGVARHRWHRPRSEFVSAMAHLPFARDGLPPVSRVSMGQPAARGRFPRHLPCTVATTAPPFPRNAAIAARPLAVSSAALQNHVPIRLRETVERRSNLARLDRAGRSLRNAATADLAWLVRTSTAALGSKTFLPRHVHH